MKRIGKLAQDGDYNYLQIGNYIQTYDAKDTPNKSPKALANNTNLEIKIPDRAAEIAIKCASSLKLGNAAADVEGTGNGYITLETDQWWNEGVGHGGSIFVRNESGDSVNVEFYFLMI